MKEKENSYTDREEGRRTKSRQKDWVKRVAKEINQIRAEVEKGEKIWKTPVDDQQCPTDQRIRSHS